MKIGVCIAGAIIQDESMLYKSINSVESLTDWDEKIIMMDGLPTSCSLMKEDYEKMLENLKIIKSKFEIKCFENNIYFKRMLRWLLDNYDCDYWLIIQDDVVIKDLDIWAELGAMDALEANIMSYPHKPILKDTHWFKLIEETGNGYVSCHGWSERCFILKSKPFKDMIKDDVRGENNFIDTIYHRYKNTKNWKDATENQKLEYWEKWRCYLNNNVLHEHLVGKRKIKST